MKKTYKTPVMIVVNMHPQQMVCESIPKVGGTTDDENDLLSRERRGSFWDDDEE